MSPPKTLVLACATVMEEILPLLPQGMHSQVFDFGLHINPAKLRQALQDAIDLVSGQYDTILLGYGLCSQAVVGLRAADCRLVVPRIDDCISIFLGSRHAYHTQCKQEPGTYYLTKGWIEVGDSPFSEFDRTVQRYGQERAEYIYKVMLGNYKRLALIDTGRGSLEKYRQYARLAAEKFGLAYEEIKGSDDLVRKLLNGPWDDDFIVLQPGESFTLEQFMPMLLDLGKPKA